MISIKYFSSLREALKIEEESIQFEGEVRELIEFLCKRYKGASDIIRNSKVAVNEAYVDEGYIIKKGDRVAILPPVGGG